MDVSSQDLIHHRLFDAYKKMRTAGKIIEILNSKDIITKEVFLKEYAADVIEMRNDLAHANEEIVDTKNVLKCIKGNREFNEDECVSLRKNLKKHFNYLNQIKTAVNEIAAG